MNTDHDESLESEAVENGVPVPGWIYLDANAFLLMGWPGHRNRPGRTGYDPLERDFEYAHVQALILQKLMTGTFRTRDPIYLIFMTCMGVLYVLYGIVPITLGNITGILTAIIYSPYSIAGVALLTNVYYSLHLEKSDEYEGNGNTFF